MAVRNGRFTADWEKPLVVFFIGMRINRYWQLGKWLPVAQAMPRMLKELYRDPDCGFLGGETLLGGFRVLSVLQYWRDFDSLEAYARAKDREHWPAWTAFNKAVGGNGSVGIFHETFVVHPGQMETIYGNMPPFGLGRVAGVVPAAGSRNEARSRMSKPKSRNAAE